MFGYVRPADGHLTAEDKSRFQAAYCGLCRSLGRRYGLAARMILNYDLAFLAMLLSREPECLTAHCRCPAHPIRGCDALEGQDAFDTAADLSVILTWWQLKDGVADHGFFRGLPYRAALLLLRRAYRKARARRPGFDAYTQAHLEELARLEAEQCPSIDRAADAFAALLAGASEEEADLENFREIGAGTFGGVVLGFLDAGGGGRQKEGLREGVRLDDGGCMGIRFRFHADEAEAVVEAHGVQGQADAAAERAAKSSLNGLFFLRPDAAGEGHRLDFPVQLILQADTAGTQADRKEGRILDSYFQ